MQNSLFHQKDRKFAIKFRFLYTFQWLLTDTNLSLAPSNIYKYRSTEFK